MGKENYDPYIESTVTTPKSEYGHTHSAGLFTTAAWPLPPVMVPDISDEHSDHQNQLKPSRDLLLQRSKLLNEKNSSEEISSSENEKMIIANQFDQKMKTIYKSDEKRLRRGIKIARKGEICIFY